MASRSTAGVASARGTTNPGFTALQAARNAQQVLCSGVTSIAVPGGTWFIDVGLRDAITAGLLTGPRIACAGRFIVTYGSILDNEPEWVGTPDHAIAVLANSVSEMITEVRRHCKHGVDFIKLADSTWGDTQTDCPRGVNGRSPGSASASDPGHHSRAWGRFDTGHGRSWCRLDLHADLATPAELEAVAEAGARLMPTMTFLQRALAVGSEFGRGSREIDLIKRNWDSAVRMLEQARRLGITLLCGTDSGNSPWMPYGALHAHEPEILVRYAGYTPMEAIVACTQDNAFVMGLEGEVGVLAAGKLADVILLTADPLADIRVLQGGQHLAMVIKDGQIVTRHGQETEEPLLSLSGVTGERLGEEQR